MTWLAVGSLVAAIVLGWVRPDQLSEPKPGSARIRRVVAGVLVAMICLPAVVIVGSAGALPWAVGIVAVAVTGVVLWRSSSHRRLVATNREAVVEACLALAGQLRSGHIPAQALERASDGVDVFAGAVAAQQVGGDVAAALRDVAARPGNEGLTRLAAAWQLCEVTGAQLAPAAAQVADSLRVAQAQAMAVEAELASPRATGRLLGFLPVVGLGLGFFAGGDPLAFLLGSPVGQWCLCAAVVLMCAGLIWVEKLAASA